MEIFCTLACSSCPVAPLKENTHAHFALSRQGRLAAYAIRVPPPAPLVSRRLVRSGNWVYLLLDARAVLRPARGARWARHGQSDVVEGTDHSLTSPTVAETAGSEQITAGRGRHGRPPPQSESPQCPPRARACALGLAPGVGAPPARAARHVARRAADVGRG